MSAAKKHRRKRLGFWATLWRHLVLGARRRVRARVRRTRARIGKALGPKVIATASNTWSGGEDLTPRIQPYPWRHYVAPEDLEIYLADIGGYRFEFELLPESGVELERAAYDAAAEHWGPFVDSQPLHEIVAISDAARDVLPEPLRR